MAWLFAKAFWDAGVPKEALQVIITDREALKLLTTSPIVKHIILTGGTDTARSIAKSAPVTPLSARPEERMPLYLPLPVIVTMLL